MRHLLTALRIGITVAYHYWRDRDGPARRKRLFMTRLRMAEAKHEQQARRS